MRLSVFDYLGEERSELNWTKTYEKVFSEGETFSAPKKIGGENSVDEISRGEIGRGANIMC